MLLELAAALCFGAAARDPEAPCSNPTRTVTPSLERARTLPNSPCRSIDPGPPAVCRFGDTSGETALGDRRLIVLRDTPRFRGDTDTCIRGALRRKRAPGPACAVPRRVGLLRDPAVRAARETGREVLDLSPFFCDRR